MRVAEEWYNELVCMDSFGYISPIISVQGCPIRCTGCHNEILWERSGGIEVSSDDIIRRVYGSGFIYQAVTFQGGEPLAQVAPLLWLLRNLKLRGYVTIIYTGYNYNMVPDEIKEYADIVKCGQYGTVQTVYHKVPIKKAIEGFCYEEVEYAADNE